MKKAVERWQESLEQRRSQGLYRELKGNTSLIDFSSNDYLGLSRNVELINSVEEAFVNSPFQSKLGSTGSRLITGNHDLFNQVEEQIATIHEAASSLLFSSGYLANLAVFSTLPQRGDTVLYDELAHACIKDGIRLSLAERYSFRHNDMTHLESKMKKAKGQIYVAVEAVYSMDGDFAPLKELVTLCQQYGALLVVDEAHSTGVYGKSGAGLVCALGLQNQVEIRIHTYGKAMGCHGAAVVGPAVLKPFLVNFARPFIYTTAMSLHSVLSISQAYQYLGQDGGQVQRRLEENIFLLNRLLDLSNKINSQSAIHALVYAGNERIKIIAEGLQNAGFDVRPILSPTVKIGTERVRICLHAYNTEEEITALCSSLE